MYVPCIDLPSISLLGAFMDALPSCAYTLANSVSYGFLLNLTEKSHRLSN